MSKDHIVAISTKKISLSNLEPITPDRGLELLDADGSQVWEVLAGANEVRQAVFGNRVKLCGIINAKSGRCRENCSFCAQSSHFDTKVEIYPLVSSDDVVEASRPFKDIEAKFSIVTSGNRIATQQELESLCESLRRLRDEVDVYRCASLGILERDKLVALREAGLLRYHHNLETSRSFFGQICTTHDYDEDIETVRLAKELGFEVCCGGIFGLGESNAQRIEMAVTLRELDVDTIPINFLNPIAGTPLEAKRDLTPLECLKIVAVYRLMFPDKDVIIGGGREPNLRQLQPLLFFAGANGMMVGNYLTTRGRNIEDDLAMIEDLGMEIEAAGGE